MIAALLLSMVLLTGVLHAENSLTATVDRTRIAVDEKVSLTITFSGASTGVPTPAFPTLSGLRVHAGPYSETKFEIVNMRRSAQTSWSYVLRPTGTGTARIGAVSLTYKRTTYKTRPIQIQVIPAGSRVAGTDPAPDVFVRVYADKTSAYPGEQVVLTYRIFFAVQITTPEIVQLPKATGFWTEEFKIPQQMSLRDEVIEGRAYKSGVFRKVALFPTTSGELVVEPMTIKTKIERQTRRSTRSSDPFFSFRRRVEPVEVRSPSVTLTIEPFPAADQPAGFSGAVGRYTLRANLDKSECDVHDAVTLTVLIRGEGNVKTLPAPRIEFPPDFESYEPKTSEKIVRSQAAIKGTKIFEYVLIPRVSGTQEIPAIHYTYFDSETKQYITASTAPLILMVNRAKSVGPGEVQLPLGRKRDIETIATDIAFAKTRPGDFVKRKSGPPHTRVTFWMFAAGPWLALAAVAVVQRRRLKGEAARLNLKRAMAMANREFASATTAAGKGEVEAACGGIARGIHAVLAAKLSIEPGSLTSDTLEDRWTESGLDPAIASDSIAILEECDRSRFTASGMTVEGVQQLITSARSVIRNIESAVPHGEARA